ncbi:MAG: aldose epimerase family protein [Chthoniobacteraceae bacterium]
MKKNAALLLALLSLAASTTSFAQSISRSSFGETPEGPAHLYTLKNKNGMTLKISDYGAAITELWAPDRKGKLADVVLGFPSVKGYETSTTYFGAVIGRYANRIAKGHLVVDGKTYQLARNNNAINHLHGGVKGFDKHLWHAEVINQPGYVGVKFTRTSPDGEENYPGALATTFVCKLTDANEVTFDYTAKADKDTVVNLTHHEYFNLAGDESGTILGTQLKLHARSYLPIDSTSIPLGKSAPVQGTPFNFLTAKPIGQDIQAKNVQLKNGSGYDHNFVLDRPFFGGLSLAAEATEPKSGRTLQVWTDQPGIQLYSGNFLDGTLVGKHGFKYAKHAGFCLETQHFPDAPNEPSYASTRLAAGHIFHSSTVLKFGVTK